jgi:ubiquinone/menaquinone biosynthesis C-methylase UbiE
MKKVEPARPEVTPDLTDRVRDFWTRNVNAERLMGKAVTPHGRGEREYFEELELQRYRSHRHLDGWIRSMQPGRSVLEIGCGIGMDSHRMARHGLRVTCIDLTQVAIDTVKDRFAREGIEGTFEVGDAEALSFPDEHFDYDYSFGVLHHVPDTERSVQEVWRVLKKGGEARIMLYHRRSLNELVHRLTGIPFEENDELCPVVRRYSREEARQLFSPFTKVKIALEQVYGEGYGLLYRMTPVPIHKALSRSVGWHMMIVAEK